MREVKRVKGWFKLRLAARKPKFSKQLEDVSWLAWTAAQEVPGLGNRLTGKGNRDKPSSRNQGFKPD